MAAPVVGRTTGSGQSMAVVPQATGAAGVNPTTPMMMNAQSRLQAANISVNAAALGIGRSSLIDSLTPQQTAQIGALLKKAGVTVKASTSQIKTILLTDPVYTGFAAQSNSFPTLYQAIANDFHDGNRSPRKSLLSGQYEYIKRAPTLIPLHN